MSEKNIPTSHIAAASKDDFAPTVLMPGDPLRAKFIAEQYFTKPRLVSDIRNILAYTGSYKNKKISVMASGMGMASIGIYSYELFKFYDVQRIVRVGSCGAYTKDLSLHDLVLARDAWSESSFAYVQSGYKENVLAASATLNRQICETAHTKGLALREIRVHCSDVFYQEDFYDFERVRDEFNCEAVEMESFALFSNARALNRQAASLLTVSDSLPTGAHMSAQERERGVRSMIELALESVCAL